MKQVSRVSMEVKSSIFDKAVKLGILKNSFPFNIYLRRNLLRKLNISSLSIEKENGKIIIKTSIPAAGLSKSVIDSQISGSYRSALIGYILFHKKRM